MEQIERYQGCLLGLAVGDAVGTAVEYQSPGSFTPIADMTGGGPFDLKAGQWTDDTSLALCLAESLINQQCFDPADQMRRYLRWFRHGHLSSTGKCVDICYTTRTVLQKFEATGDPYCPSSGPLVAGNGSIMRLAPVPMFFASDPELAIEKAADSSRTTHSAPQAVDACRYLAGLIVGALAGVSKLELLSPRYCPVADYWKSKPLAKAIDTVAAGSFKERIPPDIRGSGYVAESLEAALWAFFRTTTFREGCLLAANLGDDADTTCAVYGQLAGAFYGRTGIPDEWLERLAQRELIESMADKLLKPQIFSVKAVLQIQRTVDGKTYTPDYELVTDGRSTTVRSIQPGSEESETRVLPVYHPGLRRHIAPKEGVLYLQTVRDWGLKIFCRASLSVLR